MKVDRGSEVMNMQPQKFSTVGAYSLCTFAEQLTGDFAFELTC